MFCCLGWPFAAWLGIPIAYDMLVRKKQYVDFFMWAGLSFLVVIVPMVAIDSIQFGKLVIAPLNIVLYNVLGGHGPNLYGTEPFSFYFINGFVNFNFVWVLALFSPLALVLNYLFVPSKNKSTLFLPYWLSLSPLFLWLAIFTIQPHKEERFLFPIYPMICLSGAISLDILQKLFFRLWSLVQKMPVGTHYLEKTMVITLLVLSVTGALGNTLKLRMRTWLTRFKIICLRCVPHFRPLQELPRAPGPDDGTEPLPRREKDIGTGADQRLSGQGLVPVPQLVLPPQPAVERAIRAVGIRGHTACTLLRNVERHRHRARSLQRPQRSGALVVLRCE